jgi:hypothetical protein
LKRVGQKWHYTGIAAASLTASTVVPDLTYAVDVSSLGTGGITVVEDQLRPKPALA